MLRYLILFAALLSACSAKPLPPGQARLSDGIAQGITQQGLTAFLGIEYAQASRWAEAGPAPAWKGVKKFETFGPACPQDKAKITGAKAQSEACLYINIFAPEGFTPKDKYPVVFQIHGGGLRAGQGGSQPAILARQGLVIVTFNYRLGRLGFFDHADMGPEDIRNFGQSDMVKALQWTHNNIGAFGGNPDNITLAGHSAGGTGVQLLMLTPAARGLFSGAIARAGNVSWPFPEIGQQIPTSMPQERAKTSQALVAETPHFILPFVGGPLLPRQPLDLFRAGKAAPVPYITGGNSYDGGGILYGAGYQPDRFLALFGNSNRLRDLYQGDFKTSDAMAAQRIIGDRRYLLSARETVRAQTLSGAPSFLYYVNAPVPGQPGTPHGAEGSLIYAQSPNAMQRYWLNFFRNGNPNSADLPPWTAYDEDSDNWMIFNPNPKPVSNLLKDKLDYLDATPLQMNIQ